MSKQRISEIDGIRGVAVLLILFVHYYVQQFETVFRQVSPDFFEFCMCGAVGVDLFFVVSGFLIGGILLDNNSSPGLLKAFYLRRAFRILPLYWVVVLLAFVPSIGTYIGNVRVSFVSYAFFLQNISLCLGYLSVPILGPLWSLAIEEHFYAFAPVAFRFLRSRGIMLLVIGMVIVPPILRDVIVNLPVLNRGEISSFFTLCRLDGIGFGLLGAILWRKQQFRTFLQANGPWLQLWVIVMGLITVMLCVPVVLRNAPWLDGIRMTQQCVFFLSLVFLCLAYREGWVSGLLRFSFLRWAGARCYFLYVMHMAVLSTVGPVISNAYLATAAALGLCFVYAEISWRYFEQPLIRYASRWSYASKPQVADSRT